MLLAMYFHRIRATTYSLREGNRLMLAKVDPEAHDTWETHYTKTFIHFVQARLLTGWTAGMPLASEGDPKGNAADAALIAYAQAHRRPLVTNEAFTRHGTRADKMRREASVAGVQVFTPKEFYSGKIDEAAAIDDFIERFRAEAPSYIRHHYEPEIIGNTMAFLEGYYRHILRGETEGDLGPVRVTLEPPPS